MTMKKITIPEFIESTWGYFGPFAYEKYLTVGRGAVLIDVSSFQGVEKASDTEVETELKVNSTYVTLKKIKLRGETGEKLRTYDPEREVCFIFESGDDLKLVIGAPAKHPGPKELYDLKNNTQ